jgi:hypothetical protein
MQAKDIVYLVGIGVTLLLGAFNFWLNLRTSKKTAFINSVTAERVKWIQKLRENLSTFCGLSYHMHYTPDYRVANLQELRQYREFAQYVDYMEKRGKEMIEECDKLVMMIKLQLNPDGTQDKEIIKLLDIIPKIKDDRHELFEAKLSEIIGHAQILLKEEWEKVKDESEKGRLS